MPLLTVVRVPLVLVPACSAEWRGTPPLPLSSSFYLPTAVGKVVWYALNVVFVFIPAVNFDGGYSSQPAVTCCPGGDTKEWMDHRGFGVLGLAPVETVCIFEEIEDKNTDSNSDGDSDSSDDDVAAAGVLDKNLHSSIPSLLWMTVTFTSASEPETFGST